jgi:type 1 fimbria pilin
MHMKKSLITLALITMLGAPAAYAHGVQQQPSLLSGLLSVGNHGSVANVAATVAAPSSLANVHANVLDNSVKANVNVGSSNNNRYDSHGSSSVADVKLNVLGVVKANVDVGQSSRQGGSLLNLNASLLSGGVGGRHDRW